MDSFNENHKNFRATNLALRNSLVVWEILQNIQTSRELLNTFRLVSKLWDETAVRVLHRRKSIAMAFRYHTYTQEFYATVGIPWYHFDENLLEEWTLTQFLLLLQNSQNFPCSRFSFEFGQRLDPFDHPGFQRFLNLHGKDQIRELRILFPEHYDCWSEVGAAGAQIQTQIQTLVLRWTPHIQELILGELWCPNEFDLDLEKTNPPLKTPTIIVEEPKYSPLLLPHLHTLVLNENLQLSSKFAQRILTASRHLQVIKDFTLTPEIPGLLGTTNNPGHIRNIILEKKRTNLKSTKSDPEFDWRLDKLNLPGIRPAYLRGDCPKPCMRGPKIADSEFEKYLRIFKQTLLANRATLRKLKLKSTLYHFPYLESLPKMDNVTFFQMPVVEWYHKDHCGPTASLAKWLTSANFPSLRHLSIIVQDYCDGCCRPLSAPPECSFFTFLQPLESVTRLDILGDSGGHDREIHLDKVPRVFPKLKTLCLNSLVPDDFPAVGPLFWKMTSLERLELKIVHDDDVTILKPVDLDSAFTGLSIESLEKVAEIMTGVADLPGSCLGERLLNRANVTRGASLLDLKGLKYLDLKLLKKVDFDFEIPESLATFAPLTGILVMGPLQKLNGTRIRVWTKYGWICYPWEHK